MKYRVTWREPSGKEGTAFCIECNEENIGDAVLDYVDELFGVDSMTDGTDVWCEDGMLMKSLGIKREED